MLCVLILCSIQSKAFEGTGIIGARSAGMGRTSVCLTDFWSIQNNPAGMAAQDRISVGIAYENRFLMKELSLKSAAFVLPLNFGVIGVSFNQFGYSLYNENKIGLAFARNFGDVLRIGLQLDYMNFNMSENYENKNRVSFELGVQAQITEKICLGAYVFNPINIKISNLTDERIPVIMRFGACYSFTKDFFGTCEIEKDSDRDASVKLGLEYILAKRFYVRTGVSSNPGIFTFGLGVDLGPVQINVAGQMHRILGSSLQGGLTFSFGKK